MKRGVSRRGQVWIETVIYTLIALALIATVFSFVKPKIQQMQDKAIIEQTIVMMENINEMIHSIDEGGQSNQRVLDLGISKGRLFINKDKNDTLVFEIDSADTFSEPGVDIPYGSIYIYTNKIGKNNKVYLTLNYNGIYNITFDDSDNEKIINKASTPYRLFLSNKGGSPKTNINFIFA